MPQTSLDKQLFAAVIAGSVKRADEYLEDNANVETSDAMERTVLWHAAAKGDIDMVMVLLKNGANANAPDRDGITPIIAALEEKRWKTVEALLEVGDINARSGEKLFTALHSAINMDLREETTARTRYLLERAADAYVADGGGVTALQQAREHAQKWPFANTLAELIVEYKDGPEARQKYLADKRDRDIRDTIRAGTTKAIKAPKVASWAPKA